MRLDEIIRSLDGLLTLRPLTFFRSLSLLLLPFVFSSAGGNILVDQRGMCKLADFGVSSNLDKTLGKNRTVIGTLNCFFPLFHFFAADGFLVCRFGWKVDAFVSSFFFFISFSFSVVFLFSSFFFF